jgi:hypothetical protein
VSTNVENSGEGVLVGAFGFDPPESAAHFLVHIPTSSQQTVEISEHLSWDPLRVSVSQHYGIDRQDGQVRCFLPRTKWNEVADAVRAELNTRLKSQGKRPGKWKVGYNLVERTLGKELTLLAWGIEDADPSLIRTAIANWQGLAPEERWWMYTMTAAATGHCQTGRGIGWRKAIRYALTENPVTNCVQDQPVVPEFFRLATARAGTIFDTAATFSPTADGLDHEPPPVHVAETPAQRNSAAQTEAREKLQELARALNNAEAVEQALSQITATAGAPPSAELIPFPEGTAQTTTAIRRSRLSRKAKKTTR